MAGESNVFRSVIGRFAIKLREGQYHFDAPSDPAGLLKAMARAHVAHRSRFWHARRRDLRKNIGLDAEGVNRRLDGDPTTSNIDARNELLELALASVAEIVYPQ